MLQIEEHFFATGKIVSGAGTPGKYGAGDCFGEEFAQEMLVFFSGMDFICSGDIIDVVLNDADEIIIEEALQTLSAHGIIGAVDDMLVGDDIIHNKLDDLMIIDQEVKFFDDFDGFLFQHPLKERIDILKMIIEGFAVDTAIGGDLADGDL